jgi:hypothetical protein
MNLNLGTKRGKMVGNWGLTANMRAEIKRLAAAIAYELWLELETQRITKIGIDEIRAMIKAIVPSPLPAEAAELLEEHTTRCIVEKVG